MELFDQIIELTRRKGYNVIVGDIRQKQQEWLSFFRSNVNNFHTFNMKINGVQKQFQRNSMEMPKKICEDYHSLIWNDECYINFKDEKAKELVDNVFFENNFNVDFGGLLELSFATGMGYIVEYLDNNETKINFINFDNAIPIEYNNTLVKGIVTISYDVYENMYLTHLTYHTMKNNMYNVKHEVYVSDKKDDLGVMTDKPVVFERIFGQKKYVTEAQFKVKKPFFQVIKPNVKNHFDVNSPYGVSIYSTMLDYFKTADTLFDAFQSDTTNNRTRIIVDSQVTRTKQVTDETTGDVQYINYFDENDTVFVGIPISNNYNGKEQKAVEMFQGQYQHDQLAAGLNNVLKWIGFRAGLGKNYYSFESGQVYQNETNVISTNTDTYRNKKKHEVIIGRVLKDLVIAVLELEKLAGRYSAEIKQKDITVIFDDSIVIDDEAEEKKYNDFAEKGYIPKYKAVAKSLRISDEEAMELVAKAQLERDEENKKIAQAYNE